MQVDIRRHGFVHLAQKVEKLFGSAPFGRSPNDISGDSIKCLMEIGGTVSFVIMRPAFNLSKTQRATSVGSDSVPGLLAMQY